MGTVTVGAAGRLALVVGLLIVTLGALLGTHLLGVAGDPGPGPAPDVVLSAASGTAPSAHGGCTSDGESHSVQVECVLAGSSQPALAPDAEPVPVAGAPALRMTPAGSDQLPERLLDSWRLPTAVLRI